jgi:hypothetical protein
VSATELLEQVKALPPAEQRKFFERLQRLERKVSAPAAKRKSRRGQRALATLLNGRKIRGRTADWLRMTRGEA